MVVFVVVVTVFTVAIGGSYGHGNCVYIHNEALYSLFSSSHPHPIIMH